MIRVVVTGGTGFVGANLVRHLLKDGHEVHLLVRPESSYWRITDLMPDLHIHQVSLGDPESLEKLFKQIKPDWIFHLAVYGAYSWQKETLQIMETNLLGTIHLVQAALKANVSVFINTGSSSEYGFKDHAPVEDEFIEPNSDYAVAKASATQFCRYVAQKEPMQILTLRLYSVFGPYEEPNRLIPNIIWYGFKKKFPPLVNPNIARDYIYVDDVVDVYLLLAKNTMLPKGEVYNLGAGIQKTLSEVVETSRTVFGIENPPLWGSMPARQWDSFIWVSDPTKIKKALQWEPQYSFIQGFRQTSYWFQELNSNIFDIYNKKILEGLG